MKAIATQLWKDSLMDYEFLTKAAKDTSLEKTIVDSLRDAKKHIKNIKNITGKKSFSSYVLPLLEVDFQLDTLFSFLKLANFVM